MSELLANIGPVGCGIIGFALLYYTHLNARKQWNKKKAPTLPPHLLVRSIAATLIFAVAGFFISSFFTTGLLYTVINTIVLVTLFLLYLYKFLADVKKFQSNS